MPFVLPWAPGWKQRKPNWWQKCGRSAASSARRTVWANGAVHLCEKIDVNHGRIARLYYALLYYFLGGDDLFVEVTFCLQMFQT